MFKPKVILSITTLLLGLSGGQTTALAESATDSSPLAAFDLDAFSDLSLAFNQEQGSVRLVALLSASCGYCIKGYRYMRHLLEEIPDPRLKMLVVWEPMLSGDTRELSLKMAKKAQDPRLVYQSWDSERVTGFAFTEVMSKNDSKWRAGGSPAWDVYFVYEGDVTWSADAPKPPSYWQHQGSGPPETVLNYGRLKAEVEARLQKLPAVANQTGQ